MSSSFTFYLGSPEPSWLHRLCVPLMVSRRRTSRISKILPALCPWLLDSSGFTELDENGSWSFSDASYVSEVRRLFFDVRQLVGAFIKDWMCEPSIISKTGLSVYDHQLLTVRSYLDLSTADPSLPWLPVIQGWSVSDYLRCVDMYYCAGVDLSSFPLVGVGTLCRRQSTSDAFDILSALSSFGFNLHGFGFKADGLPECSPLLSSADSMAWSADARYSYPLPDCSHSNCANCPKYALLWRDRVLALSSSSDFIPPSPYRRRSSK